MGKLKEIVLKYKNIIAVLLTIFVAIGINVTFDNDLNALKLNSSIYNVLYILYIIFIFYIIYKSFQIKDKRLWICSLILGFIFAICLAIGDICNVYRETIIPSSKKFILYVLIKIVTYFFIFSSIIVMLINKIPSIYNKWKKENKEYKFFTANMKSFWLIALIFFLVEIPFFLFCYPGSFFWDAKNGLMQIIGDIPYEDHQPIIYTLYIGGLWNLGKALFNDGNIGFAIYSIIQMLATSLVLSYVLYYMAKKGVATKYRMITFAIFLINPLIPCFAVRIEKSIFFALLLILANIQIIEMFTNSEEYFKKKIHYFTFVIEILLISLLRNNGIYIALACFLVVLIVKRKYWKNILILFLIPVAMFYIIKGPVWKAFNIIPMGSEEALSVPLQQFARIIKYEKDNLTEEEYNEIHKYLNMTDEEIIEEYKPTISDDIKANLNREAFEEDKLGLIELYVKLFFKFPGQTISSFIINSYGYYSPNNNMLYGIHEYNDESKVVLEGFTSPENDLKNTRLWDSKLIDTICRHFLYRDIPVISLISSSLGLYFWMLLLGFTYLIYSKKYKFIIAYIPMFLLWATTIIGPLVELRYVYTLILFMMPLLGFTINYQNNKIEGGKNEE